MEKYCGKSAFQGVAIGKVLELVKDQDRVRRIHIEDIETEKKRFEEAKKTAIRQLQELYDKAVGEVGETNAAIFEVHQMMLEDQDYLDSILNMIETNSINAEYAVAVTGDNFSEMFANMDDAYMKERAADVKDISHRVVNILSGNLEEGNQMLDPAVIVADDLAPSETVQLDKEKVLEIGRAHV